jgi:signal transduction histidine kinase
MIELINAATSNGQQTDRHPNAVLVAEDDAISRRVLQASLQKWGYQVTVVDNGLAAWNTLQQENCPGMAILDWMMPEIDGVELCRKIRARHNYPYCYVLLLTARSDKDDVVLGLESGADDYLTKPFDAAELRARVRAGMRILELQQTLLEARSRLAQIVADREKLELELRQAQKLEAVGTLAAGIAHEINTPVQFVGDNLRFLQEAFASLQAFALGRKKSQGSAEPAATAEKDATADFEYLAQEVPRAISQSLEGVDRVASIVRALKEFAHPDSSERTPADLNKALHSTLIVLRNELKYVADVEEDLGELPPVPCSLGDINQVFLNLLVNAAHAIKSVVKDSGEKGKIRVVSRALEDAVEIAICDTGCGIAPEIQSKIFDPFFTTKEVGKGTGQGLAIARSIIVDKHKGSLSFSSKVGRGATFRVRLPVTFGDSPAAEAKSTR